MHNKINSANLFPYFKHTHELARIDPMIEIGAWTYYHQISLVSRKYEIRFQATLNWKTLNPYLDASRFHEILKDETPARLVDRSMELI